MVRITHHYIETRRSRPDFTPTDALTGMFEHFRNIKFVLESCPPHTTYSAEPSSSHLSPPSYLPKTT
jgi:hypothetical protein